MFVISVLTTESCHACQKSDAVPPPRLKIGMRAGRYDSKMPDMDPVADARALVSERFPAALAAFLGGGVLSDRRTPTSDLDIVVIAGDLAAPFRESLTWRKWPAELFVHRPDTVAAWFAKDLARRRPTLARMCTDGVVLVGAGGVAAAVRDEAKAVLAAGPPPPEPAELDRRRYGLSDLLDDLAGTSEEGEQAIICSCVVRETAELALVARGAWLGTGKWLLRELRAADPQLAEELLAAREDPPRLAALAGRVLAMAGGRLWDGYRQVAAS
jgi:hypothetical protein